MGACHTLTWALMGMDRVWAGRDGVDGGWATRVGACHAYAWAWTGMDREWVGVGEVRAWAWCGQTVQGAPSQLHMVLLPSFLSPWSR